MQRLDLRVGDLVWAKMKGFPHWPACVAEPKSGAKGRRQQHYVRFFATNNYAWITHEHILPHSDALVQGIQQKKSVPTSLKAAVEEIVAEAKLNPPREIQVLVEPSVVRDLALKYRKLKEVRGKLKAPRKKFFGGRQVPSSQPLHKRARIRQDPYEFNEEPAAHQRIPHVQPTDQRIGFIGLGAMGRQIARQLLETGHHLTVWNRTPERCDELARHGALRAATPAAVVAACDITFCCVAGPDASKSVVFDQDGVLVGLEKARKAGCENKGYVEMSTLDHATSQEIGEALRFQGGRYLEAQLGFSTRENAQNGMLVVLAAGDQQLFKECTTCFHAAVRHAYWLSAAPGPASQVAVLGSALCGTVCATLGECLALADRLALKRKDLLDIAAAVGFKCAIMDDKFLQPRQFLSGPSVTVRNQQKDLNLAMRLAHAASMPAPTTAASNEMYKHARRLGYDTRDASAVCNATKF